MRFARLTCIVVGVGAALLAVLGAVYTQPMPMPLPGKPLPDGLQHVPADAVGFIHVRVGDLLASPIGKDLLKDIVGKDVGGLKKFEKEVGVELASIESVTVVLLPAPTGRDLMNGRPDPVRWFPGKKSVRDEFPRKDAVKDASKDREFFDKDVKDGFFKDKAPSKEDRIKDGFKDKEDFKDVPKDKKASEERAESAPQFVLHQDQFDPRDRDREMGIEYLAQAGPVIIVTAKKALDRKAILQAHAMPGEDRDAYRPAVIFLSDRSILIGSPTETLRYSRLMARNPGPKNRPMDRAFAAAAKPHHVVAGGYLPESLREEIMGPRNRDARILAPYAALLMAESAITLDLGSPLEVEMTFNAPSEATASHALQSIKNLRALAEIVVGKPAPGGKADIRHALVKALDEAKVEQTGSTVQVQAKLDVDPTIVTRGLKEIVFSASSRANRTQSVNNLKNMALAMHGYHDANKRLPPAGLSGINDPNGKPLLSWRVAILPYVEQGPLYNKFDLTKPWDHPTNKELIPLMPEVYLYPGTDSKEGLTHYRVLVGPQSMFEAGQRINLVSITDGTSNTIMIVEAAEPTVWTRPDDLPFDPKGALPKFGVTPDGFNAAFGDGTVRFIRAGTPVETLRALITRNGGESFSFPD